MTTAQELDERYGRRRRRPLPWIALAVAASLIVAAAIWLTVRATIDSVDIVGTGFSVEDSHSVTVTFQLTVPTDRPVACALEALDEEFGVVGWRIVEYPASASHAQAFSETIPTVTEATTGLVNACWVA